MCVKIYEGTAKQLSWLKLNNTIICMQRVILNFTRNKEFD
jgi:hypothetical protein